MTRKRGKKWSRKYVSGGFIQLKWDLVDSKAWKKLTPRAVWVFVALKRKFKGFNEDDLSLTYKEVKYQMSSDTFKKAKDDLIKYGFIDIVRPGGLMKQCTIYGLSNNWKNYQDEIET